MGMCCLPSEGRPFVFSILLGPEVPLGGYTVHSLLPEQGHATTR